MKLLCIGLVLMTSLFSLAADVQPAYAVTGNDTTCQVFLYSPGEKDGLHLAYLIDNGQWQSLGQLCGSDYSQWGSEKRMYSPFVAKANDGTWRLAFTVNDHAPCLAVAYSEDLITWRPQDYPRMRENGCLSPVIFPMDDGSFDIYFKSRNGDKHYVQASADFRHFKEDSLLSTVDDVVWQRDTATVDGKLREGNQFEVSSLHLHYVLSYFEAVKQENVKNSESMRDDGKRFASLPQSLMATLKVDVNQVKPISNKLIGVFFEDISYAADGGLYAEMVQNRDFEYTAQDRKEWNATTAWTLADHNVPAGKMRIETAQPLSENNPHYVVLGNGTLVNGGWDGMVLKKGASYDFSMYVRKLSPIKTQKLRIQLVENGMVLAKADIKVKAEGWTRVTTTLLSNADAEGAELQVVNMNKESEVALDMVSLFPQDTYKGHGLRRDLAEAIADLKPKFVRFPGGCMSHGEGLDNIYHWNHTVGPWQDRKADFNIWHYHQTRGLGFYEYFQFCEDIGAEPLPVLAAGVPCQNSRPDKDGYGGQQGGIPMEDMPAYIEELCNLIEWANGDPATNKWARMRAEAGHPEPFHLKYLGIGNEDIISTTFEERCEMICKAIKKRYPYIIICGTVGPFHDPSADYIEGWRFAKQHQDIINMVDEHYYESPGWFINHLDYYDDYDRKAPKVYIGEYASRTRTHESALAEALYLCHVERNADIVEMTSYAPLLAKDGHHNWNPDMIYFNNTSLTLTPSYHTQHLFGNHSGDHYTASALELQTKLNEDMAQQTAHRMAASVVKDSESGRTSVKLVNALPREVTVKVEGISLPASVQYSGFSSTPSSKTVQCFSSSMADGKPAASVQGNMVTLSPYTVCVIDY